MIPLFLSKKLIPRGAGLFYLLCLSKMRARAVPKGSIKTCLKIKIPSRHLFKIAFRDLHAFCPHFKRPFPPLSTPPRGEKKDDAKTRPDLVPFFKNERWLQNSARHFAIPDEARNRPNLAQKKLTNAGFKTPLYTSPFAERRRPPQMPSHESGGGGAPPPRGPSII